MELKSKLAVLRVSKGFLENPQLVGDFHDFHSRVIMSFQ